MQKRITLKGIDATERLGCKIADIAKEGMVIALTGDLGAGKTTLTKAIAKGLGINENVNSPTFTLVQEYYSGKMPLYHFDAYRIDRICELDAIDFDEYFYGKGLSIVEWAELIEEELPEETIKIKIDYGEEEDIRLVKIDDPSGCLCSYL